LRTERLLEGALSLALFFAVPCEARAQAPSPPEQRVRDEARQRFDRGLTLYNAGDDVGALAEFQLAHKLTGHPVVLYNLALVQARLGHSAEALDNLERLRALPKEALGVEASARAGALYEEQLARVGFLEIKSTTRGALIQLDNVDVARTPSPPLRITAGTHFVSVSAAGHEPRHLKVTVAGRAREVLEIELTPLEVALAELSVTSDVPGVEVRIAGELVARTPLRSGLLLQPGQHELEFTRPGYATVRRRVALESGASREIAVEMAPTATGVASGGLLRLSVSESGAVVSVNGRPSLDFERGLRVPLGVHHLRVQRAGFFDLEREVVVTRGNNTIDATLLPTPEYLDEYEGRARTQRTWSYVTMGAGALVAAGSAAFLLWNQGEKESAQERFDEFAGSVQSSPSGRCPDDACATKLDVLADDLDEKQRRDVFGWVGVGVGAAGVGVGALLYTLGDDPSRYETAPESDLFGTLWFGAGPNAVRLGGKF
jgi:hypothetical protein